MFSVRSSYRSYRNARLLTAGLSLLAVFSFGACGSPAEPEQWVSSPSPDQQSTHAPASPQDTSDDDSIATQTAQQFFTAVSRADEAILWSLSSRDVRQVLHSSPDPVDQDVFGLEAASVRDVLMNLPLSDATVVCHSGQAPHALPDVTVSPMMAGCDVLAPESAVDDESNDNADSDDHDAMRIVAGLIIRVDGDQGTVTSLALADDAAVSHENGLKAIGSSPVVRSPYAASSLSLPTSCVPGNQVASFHAGVAQVGQATVWVREPSVTLDDLLNPVTVVPLECHEDSSPLFHTVFAAYDASGALVSSVDPRDYGAGNGEAVVTSVLPSGHQAAVTWMNQILPHDDPDAHLAYSGQATSTLTWDGTTLTMVPAFITQ